MSNEKKLQVVKPSSEVRKAAEIEAEMKRIRRVLARAEEDYWKALASLEKYGHWVTKTVTDHNGASHRTKRVNPAHSFWQAADCTRRKMKKRLAELEAELAAAQPAPADDGPDLSFLDD